MTYGATPGRGSLASKRFRPVALGKPFTEGSHPCRIEVSLTIAKAFNGFLSLEASLQGRIKVDGTFV
jgi:hypothetical protein